MVRQNEGRYSAQKRNLIVAPHTDDDILGVGGTIAKKAKNGSACEDILTYYYSDCDTEFCRMV